MLKLQTQPKTHSQRLSFEEEKRNKMKHRQRSSSFILLKASLIHEKEFPINIHFIKMFHNESLYGITAKQILIKELLISNNLEFLLPFLQIHLRPSIVFIFRSHQIQGKTQLDRKTELVLENTAKKIFVST